MRILIRSSWGETPRDTSIGRTKRWAQESYVEKHISCANTRNGEIENIETGDAERRTRGNVVRRSRVRLYEQSLLSRPMGGKSSRPRCDGMACILFLVVGENRNGGNFSI